MTPLTSAQKEQVAVLLGWTPCGWHPEQFVRRIHSSFDCRGSCRPFEQVVTLEAMFAYCRERSLGHDLTYWAVDGKYVAEICVPDSIENIGDAEDPDPVAALALALLTAHKEAAQ